MKPTNPVAQKAVLNSGGYKVSPRPVAKVKPKSLHGLLTGSKVRTAPALFCFFSFSLLSCPSVFLLLQS